MKLHIAGVNHNDPQCRSRLIIWMKKHYKKYKTVPAFIAVEYKKEHFIMIKRQRNKFFKLLNEKWHNLSSQVLHILTNSLAYESDAHIDIFPDVEILWLDEDREASSDIIDKYAEDRLNIIVGCTDKCNFTSIEDISEKIWARSRSSCPSNRDKVFATKIKNKINSIEDNWAIVIIGTNHAENIAGSMRNLLEQHGICCNVDFMKPSDNRVQ